MHPRISLALLSLLAWIVLIPPSRLAARGDFTVTSDPAGAALVGFGVQMNPYLYCTPNRAEVTDENVADFERKVLALRPQHVRVFFLQQWFDGRADDISKGDPRMADSFIRTCRLAQRAGATINLTHWRGPWPEPEKMMAAFADTLEKLIREHKLDAIRYVTVQNEVNYTKVTFETYQRLYRALDEELKRRGLRERIRIISGDLVGENQQAWFKNIGETIADVSDGYSIHVYWDYWDTAKLVRRLNEVPPIVAALPREQRRPLYVTEFGVRGHRGSARVEPGDHEDGTPIAQTPLAAMQLAWFQMEALNRGYVATVIWTLEDARYDRMMPYGLIGRAKDGWPLKPGYHMLRLFTHTIKPSWQAMRVEGALEGVKVAAARGPAGEVTVLALNRNEAPAISVAGLKPGVRLRQFVWNARGDGKLSRGEAMQVDATGEVAIELPPLALIALTTGAAQLE